jgi:hypothetical protein
MAPGLQEVILRVVQVSLAFDNLIGVGELKDLPHSAPHPGLICTLSRGAFSRGNQRSSAFVSQLWVEPGGLFAAA